MHTTGHAATVGKTLLFGAASAALYGLLYLYADVRAAFVPRAAIRASLYSHRPALFLCARQLRGQPLAAARRDGAYDLGSGAALPRGGRTRSAPAHSRARLTFGPGRKS